MIDVALASENDNSKIVEIVTVAHVDNQKHVDNILVQIWKVILVIKLSLSTRFQSLVIVLLLMLHVIMKFKIGLVKSFVRTCDLT